MTTAHATPKQIPTATPPLTAFLYWGCAAIWPAFRTAHRTTRFSLGFASHGRCARTNRGLVSDVGTCSPSSSIDPSEHIPLPPGDGLHALVAAELGVTLAFLGVLHLLP